MNASSYENRPPYASREGNSHTNRPRNGANVLHLFDRPIAFHRCFVTVTGSITAALMLSQSLYWQQRTKDADGWWYKTRDEWMEETGMSRREQEGARKKLRELGILHEQLRGVPATLWYRVDEIRLLELLAKPAEIAAPGPMPVGTKPPNWKGGNVPTGRAETAQQAGTKPPSKLARFAPAFKGTETTTEITTETTTTTPNPSSSHERPAKPEPERGGSGSTQDQNPEDQGSDHGIAALESNEEKTVSGKEAQTAEAKREDNDTSSEIKKMVPGKEVIEERVELAYPAKLTEHEQEDIAAQVYPLPPEVAQQMLDVIQSRIQSGQIRTNPAAVLRGIVRKYQADASSFDPSSGFQIAETRRRRVEIKAREQAEAEQRAKERAAVCASPLENAVARQSIAAMREILRGHRGDALR